ncbi:MAG: DivIVA domain-containing protein [bacterium]
MQVTPIEITHHEFTRAFHGYSPREVKDFFEQVSEYMEQLITEKRAIESEVESLKNSLAKYHLLEETLQKTLILAQKTAEEFTANAKKESEVILERTKLEQQHIRDDFASIRAMKEQFEADFQALLETYLARLKEKRIKTQDSQNGL